MTARNEVVTTLEGILPAGVEVKAYARSIDPPDVPTVLVRVDEVVPNPLPQVWRGYQFALVLVPTKTDPGPADDELDGLLEDVLFAIDQSDTITWAKATRGTYQDTAYPAYEVTLNVPFSKE